MINRSLYASKLVDTERLAIAPDDEVYIPPPRPPLLFARDRATRLIGGKLTPIDIPGGARALGRYDLESKIKTLRNAPWGRLASDAIKTSAFFNALSMDWGNHSAAIETTSDSGWGNTMLLYADIGAAFISSIQKRSKSPELSSVSVGSWKAFLSSGGVSGDLEKKYSGAGLWELSNKYGIKQTVRSSVGDGNVLISWSIPLDLLKPGVSHLVVYRRVNQPYEGKIPITTLLFRRDISKAPYSYASGIEMDLSSGEPKAIPSDVLEERETYRKEVENRWPEYTATTIAEAEKRIEELQEQEMEQERERELEERGESNRSSLFSSKESSRSSSRGRSRSRSRSRSFSSGKEELVEFGPEPEPEQDEY